MKTSHKPSIYSLEERLRSERPTFNAPEGFTDGVMARLGRQEPAPRSARPTRSWSLILAFAGAAALALITLKVIPQRPPVVDTQQLAETISRITLPEISAKNVEAFSARLDRPLEIELQNVISDTRQAIQFVASNFLPEN